MKIATIVGARPQFVKAAVVSRAINKFNQVQGRAVLKEVIIHTGQHYDKNMSDVFFKEMQIPQPDYNLGIAGATHGAMTGLMLKETEKVLLQEKPDAVLVYGDTNSTLAGALAAAKLHIPVAHVEAGLRSFNMNMPEEINRILTDRVSSWLFCPTESAVDNLQKEGVALWPQAKAYNVGDVMLDAALYYREIATPSKYIQALLEKHGAAFYLATLHRAENTDYPKRLRGILKALDVISKRTKVFMPLHPRTLKCIKKLDFDINNIKLLEPVGYFDMLALLEGCQGVFTDSGGLQKEAYFFKRPCLTLRNETEWIELVEGGFNVLASADYERIVVLEKTFMKQPIVFEGNLYGDGQAGQKIVEVICKELCRAQKVDD